MNGAKGIPRVSGDMEEDVWAKKLLFAWNQELPGVRPSKCKNLDKGTAEKSSTGSTGSRRRGI